MMHKNLEYVMKKLYPLAILFSLIISVTTAFTSQLIQDYPMALLIMTFLEQSIRAMEEF